MPIRLNDIESAFRLNAAQGLKSLDGIVEKTDSATKKLQQLDAKAVETGKVLGRIGTGLTAFGASLGVAFGFAVAGAEQEAEALRQLEGTIAATGGSFAQAKPRIDEFVQGLAQATKFTDDEIIPALNRAIIATNDVDKGMRAAELGIKLAAAGFGTLEGNASVVARLLEGQVRAIGRVIPEFRDLEDRLEAGATEASLAAEALARLQNIADNVQAPSQIQQFTKSIGELKDAIGFAVIEGFGPLAGALTKAIEAFTRFAQTGPGKVIVVLTALTGVLATVGGLFLIFAGQVIQAAAVIGGAGGATAAVTGLTTALKSLGVLLSPAGAVLAGLALLAVFVGRSVIELNKLSKASDDARDKAFSAPRIAQFNAELAALSGTLRQLREGTISATEAQEEFNRFGIVGAEAAEARIRSLEGIVSRLKDEKEAQDAAAAADAARLAAGAETARIEAVIAALEKEKQKRIELDIITEEFERRQAERGKKLADQIPPLELPPLAPVEFGAFDAPPDPFAQEPGIGVEALTESRDLFAENTLASADLAEANEELALSFTKIEEDAALAAERSAEFGNQLLGFVGSAIDGLATLGAGFAVDIVSGFQDAGKNAQRFFADLGRQLLGAITKAILLRSIIAALGGGGIGGAIGGLFQDPFADLLARFEGGRFVDLFFQGATRELTSTQDRLDSALTDNRDIASERGAPISVIVSEATPETAVEFTDRLVEPRVRSRARQRSTRGDLTGSQIDRAIDGLQGAT